MTVIKILLRLLRLMAIIAVAVAVTRVLSQNMHLKASGSVEFSLRDKTFTASGSVDTDEVEAN
jgi:hypothetical protein